MSLPKAYQSEYHRRRKVRIKEGMPAHAAADRTMQQILDEIREKERGKK